MRVDVRIGMDDRSTSLGVLNILYPDRNLSTNNLK